MVTAFGKQEIEAILFSLLHKKWDKLSESALLGEWNMEKRGLL